MLHKICRITAVVTALVITGTFGLAYADPAITVDETTNVTEEHKVSRGDTIRYTTTIRNAGTSDASGVNAAETLDSTSLVPGSFRSTPLAVDDAYSVNEDSTLTITLPGVLGNDIDLDGDSLTAATVVGEGPTNGTLLLDPSGSFTYTPDADFNGADSFSYTASDATVSDRATVTVTVTVVNDPPSFTKGANQSVDEDAVAKTITGWATAISTGPADESGQTLSFTVTNDNNGLFAVQPALSSDGTLTYTPAEDAYGMATVTVILKDSGGTNSGGNDSSPEQTFTITIKPVNDPPKATAKTHVTYSGIGLTITAGTHSGALKEGATDVDNHDPFSELIVEIVPGSLTPANATLTLNNASTGSFYFEPPGGRSGNGAASFQYKVCDNGDTDLGLAPKCSDPAIVTFNITGPDLWFVDDTDAAGCGATCNGSKTKPLVGLNNTNLSTRSTGDRIFVLSGTYNHGHTFNSSETLISQASSGSFDTLLNVSVPGNGFLDPRPSLGGTAVVLQNTVVAAASTTLRGVTIASTGDGYFANNVANLTVQESSVNAAGKAVDLTNSGASAAGVTFTSTNSTAGTHGISLQNVTGSFAFGSGSLKNNTTAAFFLKNANNSAITYGGSLEPGGSVRAVLIGTADNNSGANASTGLEAGANVVLSGNITAGGVGVYESSGGTLTLSGTNQTFSTGTTRGVELIDNNNATINFTGGNLNITTTSGDGFYASQGGTVNVSGTNNVISTHNSITPATTGMALQVMGISGEHMAGSYAFKSISSNGGTKGLSLQYNDGGFSVSGDGTDGDTLPDSTTSGGTIQSKTSRGAEFINVSGAVSLAGMTFTNTGTVNGGTPTDSYGSCGDLAVGSNSGCSAAIHLQDLTTGSVLLEKLVLDGGKQQGINGYNVKNLTLRDSQVKNFGDETREDGLRIKNLTGTSTITATTFTGNEAHQARIENDSGSLTLTISGSTFSSSAAPYGADGLLIASRGTATVTATVSRSDLADAATKNTFTGLRSDGLFASAEGNSTMTLTAQGNLVSGVGAAGVDLSRGGSATFNFNLLDNTLLGAGSHVINIAKQPTSTISGSFSGTVSGNIIGTNGTETSATTSGSGIRLISFGQGTLAATVKDNWVYGFTDRGIDASLQEDYSANNRLNLSITNNTVKANYYNLSTGVYSMEGVYVNAGATSTPTPDSGTVCASITGNTIDTYSAPPSLYKSIRVRQRFATTVQLPGYVGGVNDTTAVAAFLAGSNSTDNGVIASQYLPTGGGFVGGSPCVTP